jgi:hypothetical protein
VDEVRTVRANYLGKRAKLATQHGTQRHAYPNFKRIRELILDGAIGDLKTIHGWDARQLPRPGYPAGEGMPPAFMHYEQWIGPSPYHPYSPQYFGGSNGLNCLFWNMYRDFGVGQMGDMGAHTMDLVWNVIDAGAPSTVDFDRDLSDKFDPNITPVKLKAVFEHPANAFVMDFLGNVNVFHGRVEGGRAMAGGLELAFPDWHGEAKPATVYVRPNELEIDRMAGAPSSLRAEVLRINPAGIGVKVELMARDFGVPLNVVLTPERHAELRLTTGDSVYVFPKRVRVFVQDYSI